jgi:hypothetical protein
MGRLCVLKKGLSRMAQVGLPHGGVCRMWGGQVVNMS